MSDAITIYSTAKGYVQSAYVLMSSPVRYEVSDDVTFVLSYHMLIGFAVELYLKAYLTSTGHAEAELRGRPLAHDLDRLLDLGKVDGFNLPAADELANYLAEKHRTYEYRYMRPGSTYDVRPMAETFRQLNNLDTYVDVAIGASASRGQAITQGWFMPVGRDGWRFPA